MRVYDHGRDPKLETQDEMETRVHRDGDFYDSPPGITITESEDLESMTKAELVELAESRGVDSSGTKAELVDRLGGQ